MSTNKDIIKDPNYEHGMTSSDIQDNTLINPIKECWPSISQYYHTTPSFFLGKNQ